MKNRKPLAYRSISCLQVLAIGLAAGVPGLAMAQSPVPYTQLSVLWEVNAGGSAYTDWMTSVNPAERDSFPFLGAVAYVPSYLPGSGPLYRLDNAIRDHMDSQVAGEGGYRTDGPLAYPWTTATAVPGLTAISRLWNTSTGDHATTNPYMTAAELYPGYQADSGYGGFYGYERFGNLGGAPLAYSAGGIVEVSDSVAGGAIVNWTWNGTQFINTDDYGRLMQTAVYFTEGGVTYNPTEAGDHISGASYGSAGKWHGSPILQNQITNNVHITRGIPLDWGVSGSGLQGLPVNAANPFIYSGMQIGKNLTLNFANLGPVGQYQTIIYTPTDIPAGAGTYSEVPTAYLAATFGNFYTYDAGAKSLKTAAVPACSNGMPVPLKFTLPSGGHGGVIFSNSSGTAAMGVYGSASVISYFYLFDLRNCGNATKWSAIHTGDIPAGTNAYNTYVISGTVAQIVNLMQKLEAQGY